MRRTFAKHLQKQMRKNKDVWVVTADLGFGMWDNIRRYYPSRFINTGAAEQAAAGIAVGLALEGKIPFLYSITPFLLYRPFETIRNYINHEKVCVKLIGSGRNKDYSHDGFSHWAEEDKRVMKLFKNIEAHWPKTKASVPKLVKEAVNTNKPYYINLKR